MNKCEDLGFTIMGVPVDGCMYKVKQRLANVTIEICECEKCGHVEVQWFRQEDTEDITDEE